MQPVCAVELDDKSHQRPERQDRDALVDSALAAAGLRMVRVSAKKSYNVEELQRHFAVDSSAELPAIVPPDLVARETPVCPKCQVPMKRQTARRGVNAGKQFWGCENFPKCRETRPLGEQ